MPTSLEAITAAITEAATAGFRGRLIARGQARAMIWRDGVLPPGSPAFSQQLSFDLHSYAYGLLGLGLRLLELDGDPSQARVAFEQAATALEAVMAKGNRDEADRDFHFVMAAASYHLAHLSARAYSLLAIVADEENFSPIEQVLALLMRRDINELRARVYTFRLDGRGSDATIATLYQEHLAEPVAAGAPERDGKDFLFEGLDLALTDAFFSAIAVFLLALDRGQRALLDQAIAQLRESLDICGELNLVPQWWVHRVAIHLLSDLWSNTFHEKVPMLPAGDAAPAWPGLRELFIALLARRARAEVDLWPSQTEAASRAVDQTDNLVVSLPTSAGKTRIAELSILRCLANGRRVMFVTPLRALSAQTETTLQRTFGPLGKTISALYGSIGVSGFDEDAIRGRDIVVATPEKLDFALRNDPSLLDDVGLLVFDEGHMIGPGEREVRYEVQIQRLLRRQDADQRRIVCLSAILPDGDQMEDFSAWLRRDQPGGPITNDWRPTRLRFGEVIWNSPTARLNLRVGEEKPFVPRFLTGAAPPLFVPPKKLRTRLFPNDQRELSLATAWRLVSDGQTVLIYCPERRSVEPFAKVITDLHARGALASLLTVDAHGAAAAGAWLAQGERDDLGLWRYGLFGTLDAKQRTDLREVGLAGRTGQQAVVADAMEAGRKDVDQEPADELGGGQPHHLLPVARLDAVVLPSEGDRLGVGADQTGVGDRHSVSVTAEIGQHRLWPSEGRLGIDYPFGLSERRDPTATFANIAQHRGLFHAGLVGDIVMMTAEVLVSVMLYFIFRPVNATLSLAASYARLMMVAVMAAMLFFHAGSLALVDGTVPLDSFSRAQRIELAGLMRNIHDAGVWIWQIFFTLHLALLGLLVARSGLYPRLLGIVLIVGSSGYLVDSVQMFAFPGATALAAVKFALLLIVTLAEIGFALWLLVSGPRPTAQHALAA